MMNTPKFGHEYVKNSPQSFGLPGAHKTQKDLCETLLHNPEFKTNSMQSGYSMSKIKNNDFVPVTISVQTDHNTHTSEKQTGGFGSGFIADFHNIRIPKQAADLKSTYAMHQKSQHIIQEKNLDIDHSLLCSLRAITETIHTHYPVQADKISHHKKGFLEKNPASPLSEIFAQGFHACAEISAVTKKYLDDMGIQSTFIAGDMEGGDDSKHAYLSIKHNGKTFLFDPTNPMKTHQGFVPRILTVSGNVSSDLEEARSITARTSNIFNPEETIEYGIK